MMTAITHPGWHSGLHFDVSVIHLAFWSPVFMTDKTGARFQFLIKRDTTRGIDIGGILVPKERL